MASFWSITPSPLPPFAGLSYSARARNPFGVAEGGCGVTSPNNSRPFSINPLPSRSSASHASSAPDKVQARLSAAPSPSRSKFTPSAAFVNEKPSPKTSTIIGLTAGSHWVWLKHLHFLLHQICTPCSQSKDDPASAGQPSG